MIMTATSTRSKTNINITNADDNNNNANRKTQVQHQQQEPQWSLQSSSPTRCSPHLPPRCCQRTLSRSQPGKKSTWVKVIMRQIFSFSKKGMKSKFTSGLVPFLSTLSGCGRSVWNSAPGKNRQLEHLDHHDHLDHQGQQHNHYNHHDHLEYLDNHEQWPSWPSPWPY